MRRAYTAVRLHRRAARHSTTARHRAAPPPAAAGLAAVVAFARSQVGDRYVFGADGPGAWDCSGLVAAAYARIGVRLPHSAAGIAARAHPISRGQARPGDLVVGPGHVGIYAGGGRVIDAGNPRVGVSERPMWGGLWLMRLA